MIQLSFEHATTDHVSEDGSGDDASWPTDALDSLVVADGPSSKPNTLRWMWRRFPLSADSMGCLGC